MVEPADERRAATIRLPQSGNPLREIPAAAPATEVSQVDQEPHGLLIACCLARADEGFDLAPQPGFAADEAIEIPFPRSGSLALALLLFLCPLSGFNRRSPRASSARTGINEESWPSPSTHSPPYSSSERNERITWPDFTLTLALSLPRYARAVVGLSRRGGRRSLRTCVPQLARWRKASKQRSIHRSGLPRKSPHEYSLTKLVGVIRPRVETDRSSLISAVVSGRSIAWNS